MTTALRSSLAVFSLCALALAGCPGSKDEPAAPPEAPTGLSATPFNGAVGLSWSASPQAVTYNVYRSGTAGRQPAAMTLIASGIDSTSFNADAANDAQLYYRVTAVNSAGESAGSNEASATALATLLPATPTGVRATGGHQLVTLTWDPVPSATTYRIYWSTSPGVTTGSSSFTCASSPCTHPGLTNGQAYYYAIVALISATESTLSGEVTATPAPRPYIDATAIMMPASGGYGSYEVQVCTSSSCSVPITNATVTIAGTPLGYDGTDTYAGAPARSIAGATLELVVIIPAGTPVAAGTYTASSTMYTTGPSLASPAPGATWQANQANTFVWTHASPTTSSTYAVSAFCLNPFDLIIGMVATTQNSYVAAANTMSAGEWTAIVQIATTTAVTIPNTLAGSGFRVGAASDYVSFNVQ